MILLSINIPLHCLGVYLINCLRLTRQHTNEQLFLMSMSASQITCNILFLIIESLEIENVDSVAEYFKYGVLNGGFALHYLSMICVVLDKCLINAYNIMYPIRVSEANVNTLIQLTWSIGLLSLITTVCCYHFYRFKQNILLYVSLGYAALFLLLVVITYLVILGNHLRLVIVPRLLHNVSKASMIIIASFILFFIAPQVLYLFVFTEKVYRLACVSIQISSSIDGFVYIFLQRRLRVLLLKKMYCGREEELIAPVTYTKSILKKDSGQEKGWLNYWTDPFLVPISNVMTTTPYIKNVTINLPVEVDTDVNRKSSTKANKQPLRR